MAEETVRVYHYTSKENAKEIRKTGVIKPSEDGRFGGDKVYVTTMDPSQGKKAIATNNYDGRTAAPWEAREAQGSVDVPIPLDIPKSQLKKENDPQGRDIYSIRGEVKLPKSK